MVEELEVLRHDFEGWGVGGGRIFRASARYILQTVSFIFQEYPMNCTDLI